MATHLPLNSGGIAHTQSELAEARRPLAQASTLPPFCYTSPEFYAREVEHIFRKEWLSVRFHFCLPPEQFIDPQYESKLETYRQFLDTIHQ